MMSIEEAVKLFQGAAFERRVHGARLLALEAIGAIVEAEAKKAIGTYDFDWPQLAESTQHDRERKGFAPNEPLLRTGELRNSISHQVVSDHEVEIGSDSKVALWQELGTATIPPRPFLLPSWFYVEGNGAIREIIQQTIGAAIAGNRLDHAALHLIYESLRHLARTAKTLLDPDEENRADENQRAH